MIMGDVSPVYGLSREDEARELLPKEGRSQWGLGDLLDNRLQNILLSRMIIVESRWSLWSTWRQAADHVTDTAETMLSHVPPLWQSLISVTGSRRLSPVFLPLGGRAVWPRCHVQRGGKALNARQTRYKFIRGKDVGILKEWTTQKTVTVRTALVAGGRL